MSIHIIPTCIPVLVSCSHFFADIISCLSVWLYSMNYRKKKKNHNNIM